MDNSNNNNLDLSDYEPDLEKRKRKRNREFERNRRIVKEDILTNERKRSDKELSEIMRKQEERQAIIQQTVQEEYRSCRRRMDMRMKKRKRK
jgi:hypothetical protein